jgi:hypothetical protein
VICTIEHKASCRKEAQRVGQEKGRIGKNMMVHPSEEEPKQSGTGFSPLASLSSWLALPSD